MHGNNPHGSITSFRVAFGARRSHRLDALRALHGRHRVGCRELLHRAHRRLVNRDLAGLAHRPTTSSFHDTLLSMKAFGVRNAFCPWHLWTRRLHRYNSEGCIIIFYNDESKTQAS